MARRGAKTALSVDCRNFAHLCDPVGPAELPGGPHPSIALGSKRIRCLTFMASSTHGCLMRLPLTFLVLLLVAPWMAYAYLTGNVVLYLYRRPRRNTELTSAQRAAFKADLAAHARRLEQFGPTIPVPAARQRQV